jgi:RNA polymerase sigma factor (sigma-70 family)
MSNDTVTPFRPRPRTQLVLLTDGQLLYRFAARGDQASFAILVQRHGPMVLGVCRRILHHDQDTEDAFQATFVILARKASGISKHNSVASWLYKVAYRIALRARAAKARRRNQESQTLPRSADNGLGDLVQRELRQVLDEEVQRLPEKYRTPILLCYLQGQTNEEAAELLQCPTGTIKIRLLRGREILRKRLVRRGLALSVTALLGHALVDMARAAVPQPLIHGTVQVAAGTGALAPAVARLVEGTLRWMCMAKLKVAAIVLVTLILTCLADGLLSRAAAATAPAARCEPLLPTAPTFEEPIEVLARTN